MFNQKILIKHLKRSSSICNLQHVRTFFQGKINSQCLYKQIECPSVIMSTKIWILWWLRWCFLFSADLVTLGNFLFFIFYDCVVFHHMCMLYFLFIWSNQISCISSCTFRNSHIYFFSLHAFLIHNQIICICWLWVNFPKWKVSHIWWIYFRIFEESVYLVFYNGGLSLYSHQWWISITVSPTSLAVFIVCWFIYDGHSK